jgi:hypothetical protein
MVDEFDEIERPLIGAAKANRVPAAESQAEIPRTKSRKLMV